MKRRPSREADVREAWVLRHVGIVLAVGGIAVAATLAIGLLLAPRWNLLVDPRLTAAEKATAQDAVRTHVLAVASLIAGTVVGLLAWARLDLSRQESRRNSSRLATDRYTQAVAQLGAPDPAVRLGALYALEALARDSVAERITIAEVICAYVRHHSVVHDVSNPRAISGPIDSPESRPEGSRSDRDSVSAVVPIPAEGTAVDYRAAIAIALRLPVSWQLPVLDLRGMVAVDLDLVGSDVGAVDFRGSLFLGNTWFHGATFHGSAMFKDAVFQDGADFGRVTFMGCADFSFSRFLVRPPMDNAARFKAGSQWYEDDRGRAGHHRLRKADEGARFEHAQFRREAIFVESSFECWHAQFDDADFSGPVVFEPRALQRCSFDRARFQDRADFYFPYGDDKVGFADSVFDHGAQFNTVSIPRGFEPRWDAHGVRRWYWTGTSARFDGLAVDAAPAPETPAPGPPLRNAAPSDK